MKLIRRRLWNSVWLGRALIGLIGLVLLAGGVRSLTRERAVYPTYSSSPRVPTFSPGFAPFAVLLGSCLLVVLVVKWNDFGKPSNG
jgi:hypothetical protein